MKGNYQQDAPMKFSPEMGVPSHQTQNNIKQPAISSQTERPGNAKQTTIAASDSK